ncbi:uncharacterized protein LOC111623388 isoform X2 [Centruroides sculpturatus]|uniref:uncharacterized protein LOC111623388 isoform X2 n=1 Tax=Centruroides sculpturatus TaxID=218467 RepID=UPI000C6C9F04|nr:uncharacterized protein LOC111623388 isoform X2 [Centruroides sculpturatus]
MKIKEFYSLMRIFKNRTRKRIKLWWKIHVRILVMRYKRKLIAIQSILRTYHVKEILLRIIKNAAVIKLQKLIKLFLLNRKYNKNWPVLISFQAAIRGCIVRSKIILFTYEFMSWWRMVIQRKIYQKLYFLVQRLQSLSRGYLIRSDQMNLKAIIIFMNSTANKLQRWFRRICRDGTGLLQRKVAIDFQRKVKSNSYEELKKKKNAVTRIRNWKKIIFYGKFYFKQIKVIQHAVRNYLSIKNKRLRIMVCSSLLCQICSRPH